VPEQFRYCFSQPQDEKLCFKLAGSSKTALSSLIFCLFYFNQYTKEIAMALSQPATFNEEWSDERVFAYLTQLPPAGVNADFHVLYHAFKHMRPNDYERLLTQFVADGRDVNATNPEGQRIHDVIAQYPRQSEGFLEVLAKFA
jgi:hypothetical protein